MVSPLLTPLLQMFLNYLKKISAMLATVFATLSGVKEFRNVPEQRRHRTVLFQIPHTQSCILQNPC